MGWRVVLTVLVIAVSPGRGLAAFERVPADARSGALSEAGVGGVPEQGGGFGNPAQLAWVRSLPLAATNARLYEVDGLGWESLWGGRVVGRVALGVGAARFGTSGYRELTLAASAAKARGSVAYGARIRILALEIEGLASRRSAAVDLGVIARPGSDFTVGVLVSGLGPAGSGSDPVSASRRVSLGAGFQPRPATAVFLDVEQENRGPRRVRLGVEVRPADVLHLRAGRVTDPGEVSAGIGVDARGVGVDACVQWHPVLGFSYRVTVLLGSGNEGGESAIGDSRGGD
jgi:hypothetical protein